MGTTATALLRELSEPWSRGERTKSAINRAAKLARLRYWRAFDIWYGKARRIDDFEIDQIREALRLKNEQAARNEYHDLKLRMAALEARLSASGQDCRGPSADVAGRRLDRRSRIRRADDR